MKKKLIVTLCICVIALLVLSPLISVYTEGALYDKIENEEVNNALSLKDSPTEAAYLEKNVYPKKENITITYEKKELKYEENGEAVDIDEESKEMFILIFEMFNCERISLHQNGSREFIPDKHIEIFMGKVTSIFGSFYPSLIYVTNDPEIGISAITPNWYSVTSFSQE